MVGEADFGSIALLRDIKSDLCAGPLGFVFGEIQLAVDDQPNDLPARDQLLDPLLGVMDVFIAIGELGAERVGAAFDVACPPSTDIVDGGEGLRGSLVYRNSCGEVIHDSVSFL